MQLWEPITRWDEKTIEVALHHIAHPELWDTMVEIALHEINNGKHMWSVRAIWHEIRHGRYLQYTKGKEFKIKNDFSPWYSRWFMNTYPQYKKFFVLREQECMTQPAWGRPDATPEELGYRAEDYAGYGLLDNQQEG